MYSQSGNGRGVISAFTHRKLEANVNHQARAQDMHMQSLVELNIRFAVAAEPYRMIDGPDIIGEREKRVAVIRARAYGNPVCYC